MQTIRDGWPSESNDDERAVAEPIFPHNAAVPKAGPNFLLDDNPGVTRKHYGVDRSLSAFLGVCVTHRLYLGWYRMALWITLNLRLASAATR